MWFAWEGLRLPSDVHDDQLPYQWGNQKAVQKTNPCPKGTLSHFTGHGQILILSSLARCFTTNSQGMGGISLSNSLNVLNSRHCDHDNCWKIMQQEHWKSVHVHVQTSTALLSALRKYNQLWVWRNQNCCQWCICNCLGSFRFKV